MIKTDLDLDLNSYDLENYLSEYRIKDLPDGCVGYVYRKDIFKNSNLNYWSLKFWFPDDDINDFSYEIFETLNELKKALSQKIAKAK